jgi:hypothetical protein
VLKDGAIVEQGTHTDLLSRCGYYAELLQSASKENSISKNLEAAATGNFAAD